MFESTATWAEEKVFDPAIDDYLLYLGAWARPSRSADHGRPANAKASARRLKQYGSAIWKPLARAGLGSAAPERPSRAWDLAADTADDGFAPAPTTRDPRCRRRRVRGASSATSPAATAEWDVADSGIHEGVKFPSEVRPRAERCRSAARREPAHARPHRVRALRRRRPPPPAGSTSPAAARRALPGASPSSGSTARRLRRGSAQPLPTRDGRVTVTLADPGRFSRITAVVNSDTSHAASTPTARTGTGRRRPAVALARPPGRRDAQRVRSPTPAGASRRSPVGPRRPPRRADRHADRDADGHPHADADAAHLARC